MVTDQYHLCSNTSNKNESTVNERLCGGRQLRYSGRNVDSIGQCGSPLHLALMVTSRHAHRPRPPLPPRSLQSFRI